MFSKLLLAVALFGSALSTATAPDTFVVTQSHEMCVLGWTAQPPSDTTRINQYLARFRQVNANGDSLSSWTETYCGSGSNFIQSGLKGDAFYEFQIKGLTHGHSGTGWGSSTVCETNTNPPPDAPFDFECVVESDLSTQLWADEWAELVPTEDGVFNPERMMGLRWRRPDNKFNGIIDYVLERREPTRDGRNAWEVIQKIPEPNVYRPAEWVVGTRVRAIDGPFLNSSTPYKYRVTATNRHGLSDYSEVITCVTEGAQPVVYGDDAECECREDLVPETPAFFPWSECDSSFESVADIAFRIAQPADDEDWTVEAPFENSELWPKNIVNLQRLLVNTDDGATIVTLPSWVNFRTYEYENTEYTLPPVGTWVVSANGYMSIDANGQDYYFNILEEDLNLETDTSEDNRYQGSQAVWLLERRIPAFGQRELIISWENAYFYRDDTDSRIKFTVNFQVRLLEGRNEGDVTTLQFRYGDFKGWDKNLINLQELGFIIEGGLEWDILDGLVGRDQPYCLQNRCFQLDLPPFDPVTDDWSQWAGTVAGSATKDGRPRPLSVDEPATFWSPQTNDPEEAF